MPKSLWMIPAGLLSAAVVLVLLAASPANADPIYTTGGTPPSYISTTGYGDYLGVSVNVIAQSFVPTETAILTDVQLPLELFTGPSDSQVTVYIESSVSGAPSGTILDTLGPTGSISSTTPQIFTVTCTGCSTLTEGTAYFVVVEQTAGAQAVLWTEVSPSTDGSQYLSTSGPTATFTSESDTPLTAFEVDGTPVGTPEPSSLLLLGAGLLGLLVIARKRFAAEGPDQS